MMPTEAIEFWLPSMGDLWRELAPEMSMIAKQMVLVDWINDVLRHGDRKALDSHRRNLPQLFYIMHGFHSFARYCIDPCGVAVWCNVLSGSIGCGTI